MPALNGYGTFDGFTDTAAETFITSGLSKVLKINNICDSEHLADCGIPVKITKFSGNTISFPKSWNELNPMMTSASYTDGANINLSHSLINAAAAAFETANGESIALFYNPRCESDMKQTVWFLVSNKVCVNMIYDLNGSKGPNTVGKDIGYISVLYPTDSYVVAPLPVGVPVDKQYPELISYCREKDNARLPIREELISMFANKNLFDADTFYGNIATATSSENNANMVYYLFSGGGVMNILDRRTAGATGQCIQRN